MALLSLLKWDTPFRWSFGPNSTSGSIETTTIGKTGPTLESALSPENHEHFLCPKPSTMHEFSRNRPGL